MPQSEVRIDVRDLRKLRRALNQVDKEQGRRLREANKEAARTVLAATEVPVGKTGKLKKSTGVRASQTSASLKSGSRSRVPYGPPVHWGWPRRGIAPQEYIYAAIVKTRDDVRKVYEETLQDILKDAGLGRRF